MRERKPAQLVLEDGTSFQGRSVGAEGLAFGEVVFNTSMMGYQEILTDPSYAGQIIAMTAAHIGNTGVNDADLEAARSACTGFVMREAAQNQSSWRADDDLASFLAACNIVGIDGIDTRALTRVLRDRGSMLGVISTQTNDVSVLVDRVKATPCMVGRDLVRDVTCDEMYRWDTPSWMPPDLVDGVLPPGVIPPEPIAHHVVAYDFGIKRAILRRLRDMGCRITVVPATTTAMRRVAIFAPIMRQRGNPTDVGYATLNGIAVAGISRSDWCT